MRTTTRRGGAAPGLAPAPARGAVDPGLNRGLGPGPGPGRGVVAGEGVGAARCVPHDRRFPGFHHRHGFGGRPGPLPIDPASFRAIQERDDLRDMLRRRRDEKGDGYGRRSSRERSRSRSRGRRSRSRSRERYSRRYSRSPRGGSRRSPPRGRDYGGRDRGRDRSASPAAREFKGRGAKRFESIAGGRFARQHDQEVRRNQREGGNNESNKAGEAIRRATLCGSKPHPSGTDPPLAHETHMQSPALPTPVPQQLRPQSPSPCRRGGQAVSTSLHSSWPR